MVPVNPDLRGQLVLMDFLSDSEMSSLALYSVHDGIATLTLNQPERLNTLTPAMQQACLAALQQVREDADVRALLLTANGRGFCSGADLAEIGDHEAKHGKASLGEYVGQQLMADGVNRIIAEIRLLPVPVVCAINGVAAGGGAGLALAGDLVVASRSASFYLPFVPMLGLVPDMGLSWILPRAIGRARAIGLALTGEKLAAEQAAAWGLIWDCVDDELLHEEALALAGRLAKLPARTVVEVRALFAASDANDLEQQLDLEREYQVGLIDSDSFTEGLRAFRERRHPVFPGRR